MPRGKAGQTLGRGAIQMGWKTRGGRSYYYQSERVGGRTVSRYVGIGETAQAIAEIRGLERETRVIEEAQARAKREKAERLAKRIARACRRLALVAEAMIEDAGYHRHNRGQWRRRRTMNAPALTAPSGCLPAESMTSLAERDRSGDEAARKEVRGLIAKADKGDKEAARKVAQLMKASPEIAERAYTDLSCVVEASLVRKAFGAEALARAEAAHIKLQELRQELAGPKSTLIERLLAERVALCWLDCNYTECIDVQTTGRSFAQADFNARQRDRSHRRYLSALKALASVRKLPIVAVQVNVGAGASGAREVLTVPSE